VIELDDKFQKIVDDIRALRIQGATNIAIEGVKAFSSLAERIDFSSLPDYFEHLKKASIILSTARDTEPALRNGLHFILYELEHQASSVSEAKELVSSLSQKYVEMLKDSKRKVISYGAHRIRDNSVIMTHCHSSLSTGIIIEAHRQGKNIEVFLTETRPKWQGRITAKEMVGAEIPTTMVVDSAMRYVINRHNVDIVITGADAITSQGTVINKIGTRLLALAAREMDVPFYTAINLLKYDASTTIGKLSAIEFRPSSEVWEDPPKGLKILNPAFETVSRDLIDGVITEAGIFAPSLVYMIIKERYPFMLLNE